MDTAFSCERCIFLGVGTSIILEEKRGARGSCLFSLLRFVMHKGMNLETEVSQLRLLHEA
jgi:hypothetical protein